MTNKRKKSDHEPNPNSTDLAESQRGYKVLFLRHDLFFLLCLIPVVFLIYSNTFNDPFHFDDVRIIQENPSVRLTTLSVKNIKEIGSKSLSANRPVSLISFALNYYFHGYQVMGYHVVNTLIHILTGLFLYFLLKVLLSFPSLGFKNGRNVWIPFFTALIWLVHPIQTQSVTYIVQRMNSLSAMFYVLSLLLYVKARIAKGTPKMWPLFLGCILAGLMAVGSKEIAATLPLFIFLLEWYFFQELSMAWLKKHFLPIAGLSILIVILSLMFLGSNPLDKILSGYKTFNFTLTQRVLTEFRVVVYYIGLLIFPYPSRLNLDHDFPLSHDLFDPVTTLFSLVAIMGLIGLAVYSAKRRPLFSFCIFWFFGNLVIESSIIALDIVFEHRAYLPSMFLILLFVILVSRLKKPKWLGIGVLCCVTIIFSYWTYERNNIWRNEVTLWKDCVLKSPQKARPHYNLGTSLSEQGKTTEAIEHYLKAIEIKPNYAEAYGNLGVDLMKEGQTQEAIRRYRQALRIKPEYAKAHYNLGFALLSLSQFEEAANHFSEAVRIDPDYAKAHHNLGIALVRQSKDKEAIPHFNEALRINPESAKSHNNLGAALYKLGNTREAIHHYREALRIDPEFEEAQMNLGVALSASGNPDMAIKYFSQVLRTKPENAEAHYKLGALLTDQGRTEEAIGHFLDALRAKPDHEKAHYNLGTLLYGQGRIKEAMSHFSEALRIKPDFAEAHNNLGIALYADGNYHDAIDHYKEALKYKPDYAEAHNNMGVALAGLGKMEEATNHFLEALRIKPDYTEARRNREKALLFLKKQNRRISNKE